MAGPSSKGNPHIPKKKEAVAAAPGDSAPEATGQSAGAAMNPEDMKRQADEAKSKLTDVLLSNPHLDKLLRGLGFGQPQDPAQAVATNFFADMVGKAMMVPEDQIRNGKMVNFDNSPESVIHNLREKLSEAFNAGKLTFDKDPTINQQEFAELMKEVEGMVKSGRIQGGFDSQAIARHIATSIAAKGADLTIRMEEKMPKLEMAMAPEPGGLGYGAKMQVTKDNLANIPFTGKQIQTMSMDEGGHFGNTEKISPRNLGQALGVDLAKGGSLTIERVTEGNGVNKGFFISNEKGQGFYVGPGAIDVAALKDKNPELYAQLKADPAPAPAPKPDNDLDVAMVYKRQDPALGMNV